jgi:hypothetical protein
MLCEREELDFSLQNALGDTAVERAIQGFHSAIADVILRAAAARQEASSGRQSRD